MKDENKIEDGGPAFPFGQVSETTGQPINGFFNPGMSLRDWFAGQVVAGLCANSRLEQSKCASLVLGAYEYADAMLAQRSKSIS